MVQIYSAFIYEGFGLVERIKKDLSEMVKKDGFKNISQAVGVKFNFPRNQIWHWKEYAYDARKSCLYQCLQQIKNKKKLRKYDKSN